MMQGDMMTQALFGQVAYQDEIAPPDEEPIEPPEEDDDDDEGDSLGHSSIEEAGKRYVPKDDDDDDAPEKDKEPDTEVATVEVHYPDWIPPALKLDNAEVSAGTLREKYEELVGFLSSPRFEDALIDTYGQMLLQKQGEIENFAQMYEAFRKDPTGYVKLFMPETAAELGLEPLIEGEMREEILLDAIRELYPDFDDVYDSTQALKPGTPSRMIYQSMQKIEQYIDEKNAQNKVKYEEALSNLASKQPAQQQSPEEALEREAALVEEFYYKDGLDKEIPVEDYLELVEDISKHQPTMRDLIKGYLHEELVEVAQKEAYEQGRKDALSGVRSAAFRGAEEFVPKDEPKKKTQQNGLNNPFHLMI